MNMEYNNEKMPIVLFLCFYLFTLSRCSLQQEYTHVEIVNASLNEMNSTGNSSIIYKKSIRQTKGVNFMGNK